jgi:hypothetical protein
VVCVPTLDDHAALEASRADYRAVLAAVNALGANQRKHSLTLADVKRDMADVKRNLSDLRTETRALSRSTDEHFAEMRDLIVGRRNG